MWGGWREILYSRGGKSLGHSVFLGIHEIKICQYPKFTILWRNLQKLKVDILEGTFPKWVDLFALKFAINLSHCMLHLDT